MKVHSVAVTMVYKEICVYSTVAGPHVAQDSRVINIGGHLERFLFTSHIRWNLLILQYGQTWKDGDKA